MRPAHRHPQPPSQLRIRRDEFQEGLFAAPRIPTPTNLEILRSHIAETIQRGAATEALAALALRLGRHDLTHNWRSTSTICTVAATLRGTTQPTRVIRSQCDPLLNRQA
jgi:hypothetical protein